MIWAFIVYGFFAALALFAVSAIALLIWPWEARPFFYVSWAILLAVWSFGFLAKTALLPSRNLFGKPDAMPTQPRPDARPDEGDGRA